MLKRIEVIIIYYVTFRTKIWFKTIINRISPINITRIDPFSWTEDHLDSSWRPWFFEKNQTQNASWKVLYQKILKKKETIRKLNLFVIKIDKVNRPSLRYLTNLCNADFNRTLIESQTVNRSEIGWSTRSRSVVSRHVARTRETRSPIQQRRGDRLEIGSRRRW